MAKHCTANDSGDFDISYTANANGISTWNIHHINCVILVDIRRELRKLNSLLGCTNFINIPRTLREIQANTTKHKYVRKEAVK